MTKNDITNQKIALGIDLGTNSLGLAAIDLNNKQVLFSQVYSFPAGKTNLGQGNSETANNQTRREKRQSRRQYFRKRLRKQHLLKLLIDLEMTPLSQKQLESWTKWNPETKARGEFPNSKEFVEWLKLDPYELRAKALKEDLSKEEFGRILYSMIQRRGFLSSRKSSDEGALMSGNVNMIGINQYSNELENKTLGQYLYKIGPKTNQNFSLQNQRIRGRYTLRDMYIDEFDKIWDQQAHQLGLDKLTKQRTKRKTLTGNLDSKQNKKIIQALKKRYQIDSIESKNDKHLVTYSKELPLKEYLGGKIWRDESGNLRYLSNDSILFWQRPLRSQKNLVNKCTYEGRKYFDKDEKKWYTSGPTVVTVSHPLFELYRAWKSAAQIKFNGRYLSMEQKMIVVEELLKGGKDVKFKNIRKKLELQGHFNYNSDEKFSGAPTIKGITTLLNDKWSTIEDIDFEKYTAIWHLLYTYDDNLLLLEKLKATYGLATLTIEDLNKIKLEEGYSNISLRAIRNILPYLEKGYKESDAILMGGVKNAFGKRFSYFTSSHEEIEQTICKITSQPRKEGEAIEMIKEYLANNNYGFEQNDKRFLKLYHHSKDIHSLENLDKLLPVENLKNPLVEQSLWTLRRAVNALLEQFKTEYGKDFQFDRINVELTRELKSSVEKRYRIRIRQNELEEINNEARDILRSYDLATTRENIQKYKLYKEVSERNGTVICPYTGKTIGPSDLLGTSNKFQIEHIVPLSKSLNDSFANKTLCDSEFNRLKGNRTPFEFYKLNSSKKLWNADSWDEIKNRAYRLLPFDKYKLFTSEKSSEELAEGMANWQLSDTSYMTRYAVSYLKQICNNVNAFPGSLTAEIRSLWGLNSILAENIDIAPELIKFNTSLQPPVPVYIVRDKTSQKPISITPKINTHNWDRTSQTLITSLTKNKKGTTIDKVHLNTIKQFEELDTGDYKIKLKVEKIVDYQPILAPYPILDGKNFTFKCYAEIKGKTPNLYAESFTETSKLPNKIFKESGSYWVHIPIKNVKIDTIETDKKLAKSEVKLRYVAKGDTIRTDFFNLKLEEDYLGPIYITIDLDYSHSRAEKIKLPLPPIEENHILIEGEIKQNLFTSHADIQFSKPINGLENGLYYAVANIDPSETDLAPIYNPEPKVGGNKECLEGKLYTSHNKEHYWIDYNKNRDDHRHHAIDAIVIALLNKGIHQQLSSYYSHKAGYNKGQDSKIKFDQPWEGFREDVKESIEQIIVHHKKNDKVINKVSKIISTPNGKYRVKGLAAKGQLHKETFYGKRRNPLTGQTAFHLRKPITDIKTVKQIDDIVDHKIRERLKEHLIENFGFSKKDLEKKTKSIPNEAFIDKNGNYIFTLPNTKGGDPVPIKRIRLSYNISGAERVNDNINRFVDPRNNDHILIYKDVNGKVQEECVTFWEVSKRLRNNQNRYQLPNNGVKLLHTIKKNDMFILGLDRPEIEKYLKYNKSILSEYIYKAQAISTKDYRFIKHYSSRTDDASSLIRIRSVNNFIALKPQKIHLSLLGDIELIDNDTKINNNK